MKPDTTWTTFATITVAGIPKAQPRPRAFARNMGGKVVARMYDAGTAEGWKGAVALAVREHLPTEPIARPVRLDIDFYLPRPKRLMRRCDPDGCVWAVCKPDRDNLDKAVMDALTTLGMWADDCLVVAGEVRKFYHAKAGRPGATITIAVAGGAA